MVVKEMMKSKSNAYELMLQDDKILNKNIYEEQI